MPQSRLEILAVVDGPHTQFFRSEAMASAYAVTMMRSAEDAIDALTSRKFDLVLMDVRLPGVAGYAAVKAMQDRVRWTPIVVMTTPGARDAAVEAVRRGACDYLTTPFTLDELEIVIRRALEQRRLIGEVERLREQLAATTALGQGRWETLQDLSLDEKVTQLERAFVMDALTRAGGVQAAAARLLGVTERSVWHLVKKHRIEVSRLKQRRLGGSRVHSTRPTRDW